MNERVARLAILALILVILGSIKAAVVTGRGPYGSDGGNYFQLARNVAEGKGLVTNISLYHAAHLKLPARSWLTYPLWPLVLGYAGRVIGMHEAANLLPKVLYVIALALLYGATNGIALAVAGKTLISERLPHFDFGHLGVLFLGTNWLFFQATSFPYTEGLAFSLLFASMVLLGRPELAWRGAAAGLCAGLGLLTRTQLMVLVPAGFLALMLVSFADRRALRSLLAFSATAGGCLIYWYFAIHRMPLERADVPFFQMWVETDSAGEFLRERFEGLIVSLNPRSPFSYFRLYGPSAAIPFIALGAWVIRRRSVRVQPPRAAATAAVFAVLAGAAFFVTLNFFHETFFLPWLFGYRHGLPYVLWILVGFTYLLAQSSRILRAVTVLLLAASMTISSIMILDIAMSKRVEPTVAETQLSTWLERQNPLPTVLTTRPQDLTIWSHAYFHWILCRDDAAQTRLMLKKLPIDYVAVYETERQCPFIAGLQDVLTIRMVFGDAPLRIWLLGRK